MVVVPVVVPMGPLIVIARLDLKVERVRVDKILLQRNSKFIVTRPLWEADSRLLALFHAPRKSTFLPSTIVHYQS